MPSSSRARCGTAALTSSGWVNSRSVWPTSSSISTPSISASDWLASTIRPSSIRTSAMPVGAEWNACWNRRRACWSARECCSRSDRSRNRSTIRRSERSSGGSGGFDPVGRRSSVPSGLRARWKVASTSTDAVVADEADRRRLDDLAGQRPAPTGPQFVAIGSIDEVEEEASGRARSVRCRTARSPTRWPTARGLRSRAA